MRRLSIYRDVRQTLASMWRRGHPAIFGPIRGCLVGPAINGRSCLRDGSVFAD